jgi:dihydropteroate synthase
MAVVNLTPDSFFDGGNLLAARGATTRTPAWPRGCVAGSCSRAPTSSTSAASRRVREPTPVDGHRATPRAAGAARLRDDPELARVPISVDTRHAEVARAAMAGRRRDHQRHQRPRRSRDGQRSPRAPAQAWCSATCAASRPPCSTCILRRSPGRGRRELGFAVERALRAGVPGDRIVVDPGIGFGKTAEQSAALVAASIDLTQQTGCPVLIGASRKAFLGAITGKPVGERMIGSVAAAVIAVERGRQRRARARRRGHRRGAAGRRGRASRPSARARGGPRDAG